MMKFNITRFFAAALVLVAITVNAFPCGPGYVTPVFDNDRSPESPYRDFASGNLGIVKPTYRRMVLLAAYRYLTGGGFSDSEQQALIEFWQSEIDNRGPDDTVEVETAVKSWVAARKGVVGNEAKTPDIYVERAWGGYDFFPNCTRNAFETATKTLSDRVASHGSDDKDVKNWLKAQDQVFANCSSGRSIPAAPSAELSEWLQKDRAYQIAAAEFYALDYRGARQRFAEIALDTASPWQETAEYLVGRTLIREASLNQNPVATEALYVEADQVLQSVAIKGGKFADDADRLLGVVKYRLRPQERVRELAQKIAYQSDSRFRQDLVDYNWLLDKYEKETLETEEKRKAAAEAQNNPENTNASVPESTPEPDGDKIMLYLYIDDQSYMISIPATASDDDAVNEAQRAVGKPLTDKQKEDVRSQRQSAYAARFTDRRDGGYQGGYWGSETMRVELLPAVVRQDELSEWLFTYQIQSEDAYQHARSRYRETGSLLWLITSIVKAQSTSVDLPALIEAAENVSTSSPAYATVGFHLARLELEQGKSADAKKRLDDLIASPVSFPESTRNQFAKMRMSLSTTVEDYFRYALRKPFAFDFDGRIGTLEEHLAEQKSWYSPEAYPEKTREQYDRELEEQFAQYRRYIAGRTIDSDAISALNRYFPTETLIEAQRLEILPDHLRKQLAIGVWSRAVLTDNELAAKAITPRLLAAAPELADDFVPYLAATTPAARKRTALFIILKNPMMTPAIETGFGKDNLFGEWDADNWWCEWLFSQESEEGVTLESAPKFLTKLQLSAAKSERAKLSAIGDAPKYFHGKTIEWLQAAPADKRLPEALYIAWASNGWTKYGCGNGPEIQEEIATLMRKRFPNSAWTKKLDENPEQ